MERGELAATRRLVAQLRADKAAGGTDGLRVVARAFGTRVLAFQTRLMAGNRESAREAWNDTLLQVWERIDDFDPRKSAFRTWVYNLAKYAALKRKRELGRERRAQLVDAPPDLSEEAPPTLDVLTARERRALQKAFKRLRPVEQELLWRRYVAGLMPSELQSRQFPGLPSRQVSVYLNRAAARLRKMYTEELGVAGEC